MKLLALFTLLFASLLIVGQVPTRTESSGVPTKPSPTPRPANTPARPASTPGSSTGVPTNSNKSLKQAVDEALVLSKQPCNPAKINLRGLKIGDTKESVEEAVVAGEGRIRNSSVLFPKTPAFKGVSLVPPVYFEGKVYSLTINYDNSVKWNHAKEMVDLLSNTWNLSKDNWTFIRDKGALTECSNVLISLYIYDDSSQSATVTITDSVTHQLSFGNEAEKESAKKKLEAEKQKAFKP